MNITVGFTFKSVHFEGTVTVLNINESKNELEVEIKASETNHWTETWNLQHTIWGFDTGDYFPKPSVDINKEVELTIIPVKDDKPKIGDKVYPCDNSYAINLTTGSSDSRLAGTYNTPRKLVTLISEPFKFTILTCTRKLEEREFVLVQDSYKHIHRVLNCLSTEQKDLLENHFLNDPYRYFM